MTNPFNAGMDQSLSKASEARTKVRMDNLRNRLMGGVDKNDPKKLRKACQDFEAVFMNKMWQKMRATVPKAGYLHSRFEDQYLSMFDHEMSKKFASAGGIGLADMMFSQLSEKLAQKSQTTAPGGPPRPLNEQDNLPGQPSVRQESVPEKTADASHQSFENPAQLAGVELAHRVDSLAARIELQMAGNGKTVLASREGDASVSGAREASASAGDVITPYGWSRDPESGERRFSSSVELAMRSGESVSAVRPGQVAYAGNNGSGKNSNMVIINHGDGMQSRYEFQGNLKVSAGQRVEVGKPIATIEQNNPDILAALRFEMRRNGQAENPEPLVNRVIARVGAASEQHTG
jgi:Rod binding domain-containing protein